MSRPRKPLKCETCAGLANCFVRKSLSDEALALVEVRRSSVELKRGELLYHAGDKPRGIWVVCSGRVKSYFLTEQGKALITSIGGPGEIMGHSDYINERDHREFAEALDTVVVALLDAPLLEELMVLDPGFTRQLMRRLAADVLNAEERAVNIAYRSAKERVMDVLNEFDDEAERYDPCSAYPIVAARRQELAERAGLTIETTVRMLKQLERAGDIKIDGRRIQVRNRLRETAVGLAA